MKRLKELKNNKPFMWLLFIMLGLTCTFQTINTINQGYFDGVVVGSGDLDLNGNDFIIDTDGDTNIHEGSDDEIIVTLAGGDSWRITASDFGANGTTRAILRNEAPSDTNPVIIADRSDLDTGQGSAGADIMSLIAGGGEGIRVTEASNQLEVWLKGSQRVNVTPVTDATYSVLQTDYYLQCTRTATGVCTITLPAISTVGNGFIIKIKDSGYNANTNNITVARTGSDTIDNTAGSYTINGDGDSVSFISNSTTTDWEIF